MVMEIISVVYLSKSLQMLWCHIAYQVTETGKLYAIRFNW